MPFWNSVLRLWFRCQEAKLMDHMEAQILNLFLSVVFSLETEPGNAINKQRLIFFPSYLHQHWLVPCLICVKFIDVLSHCCVGLYFSDDDNNEEYFYYILEKENKKSLENFMKYINLCIPSLFKFFYHCFAFHHFCGYLSYYILHG